jgi:hypothetical protein
MSARSAIDPHEIARPEILDPSRIKRNHHRPVVSYPNEQRTERVERIVNCSLTIIWHTP